MQSRCFLFIYFLALVFLSCQKEGIGHISVEGVVRDDVSNKPLGGIMISVDGIKPPSGSGFLSGKRETIGKTKTDANGHYKVKVKLFKGADRIELFLDPGELREHYAYHQEDFAVSDLNKKDDNILNLELSPTTILKINFKNAHPASDSDFFYFSRSVRGNGTPGGKVIQENCGTVPVSEALTWTGKDVCGAFTVNTFAERYTTIFWTVRKNGILKYSWDSVFAKRNVVNEFQLNY